MIPYSVSIPQTFRIAIAGPYSVPAAKRLQILAGAHTLDGPSSGGFLGLGHEGADVDDRLALLPRDLGPVGRVGGVRQVLVLVVLLLDRGQEVRGAAASALAGAGPRDARHL